MKAFTDVDAYKNHTCGEDPKNDLDKKDLKVEWLKICLIIYKENTQKVVKRRLKYMKVKIKCLIV